MADETTGEGMIGEGTASNDTAKTPAAPPAAPEGAPIAGAPSAVPPADAKPLQEDIAKILKDIKLPERRDFKPVGEAKPAQKQIPLSQALEELERPIENAVPEAAAAPKKDDDAVVPLHTLKQDLQQIVHDQKISYVHAMALEEDKPREGVPDKFKIEPRRRSYTTGILVTVGILLFVGAAALGGVYLAQLSNRAPLPVAQSDSLVFAEQTVSIPITGVAPNDLKNQLAQVRAASHANLGSITRIVPLVSASSSDGSAAAQEATLAQFLGAIGANPPDSLMRALSGQFFLGLHTIDTNAPFLLIPVTDYDHAFSGMLEWEATLNGELSPFFTPVPQFVTGPDGLPAARSFSDVVMSNYDARALKDDGGQIELYYSFPSRGVLIIAESPYTFSEVLRRLQAQRQL